MATESGYGHLNVGGTWGGTAVLSGAVVRADGALTLAPAGEGWAPVGTFVVGPLVARGREVRWQRLRAEAVVPPGCRLNLFTRTGPDPSAAVAPLAAGPPFGDWRPAPPGATDFLVPGDPAVALWVGGVMDGDGAHTPEVHQVRAEYDRAGWLDHLPGVYGRNDGGFLAGALALFRAALEDDERLIDDLPRLFDPAGAPAGWLDWLAGWVAADLDDGWPVGERRDAVARAVARHARRGTAAGLRDAIERFAGVRARVTEPAAEARLWAVGAGGLGFDTMLAPAEPDGAILGTTAVLGGSELRPAEEYGAPVFADVAHRFCVSVYATDLPTPEAADRVRAVVDREQPAHTTWGLAVIGPHLRVGVQARVGVDAIVAGPAPAVRLDGGPRLDTGGVLGADPAARAGVVRIGAGRVGG